MDINLRRGLIAEALGTFAVVYFSNGAFCVNCLATPNTQPGSPLHALQPGLIGIALASGLALWAALAVTLRQSGGFLNPAITLMLWVFNRLDNKRAALLLAVQLASAFAAGTVLRFTFDDSVLRQAHLGTPHLNPAAFPMIDAGTVIAGTSIELVLTFFLVFAIFGVAQEGSDAGRAALPAGLMVVAGTVLAGPLTGAAFNPARWFGTVLWEQMLPDHTNPWGDTFVFLSGPILGALVAGLVTFRLLAPEPLPSAPAKKK